MNNLDLMWLIVGVFCIGTIIIDYIKYIIMEKRNTKKERVYNKTYEMIKGCYTIPQLLMTNNYLNLAFQRKRINEFYYKVLRMEIKKREQQLI